MIIVACISIANMFLDWLFLVAALCDDDDALVEESIETYKIIGVRFILGILIFGEHSLN